jgi:hypothetical protein
MAEKQATELLDTARMLRADATKRSVSLLNSELDLSKTFAEQAWELCLEGKFPEAKLLALVATEAYQTAKKFVTKLGMSAEQRERLALKIGIVTPLIERLAAVT